jgi:hypothetical protein
VVANRLLRQGLVEIKDVKNHEKNHLPRRAGRLIVGVLGFHCSIDFSNCKPLVRASKDGAAENNRKRVLRSSISIR